MNNHTKNRIARKAELFKKEQLLRSQLEVVSTEVEKKVKISLISLGGIAGASLLIYGVYRLFFKTKTDIPINKKDDDLKTINKKKRPKKWISNLSQRIASASIHYVQRELRDLLRSKSTKS